MKKTIIALVFFASCTQKQDTTAVTNQLTNLKKEKMDSLDWAKEKQDSFEKLEFKKISKIRVDTITTIGFDTIRSTADSVLTDTTATDPYYDSSYKYLVLRHKLMKDIDDIEVSMDSLDRIK